MKFVIKGSLTGLPSGRYSSSIHPASYSVLWRTVPHKFTFLGFFENWLQDRVSYWEICKKLKVKKEYFREFLPSCHSSLHDFNALQVIPVEGYDSFPPTLGKTLASCQY